MRARAARVLRAVFGCGAPASGAEGSLHDGPHEGGRAGDSLRVGRGHGHGVGPERGCRNRRSCRSTAMVMPGGSPVAVKVRVWAVLESTACMANDTAGALRAAVAEGVDDADRLRARHARVRGDVRADRGVGQRDARARGARGDLPGQRAGPGWSSRSAAGWPDASPTLIEYVPAWASQALSVADQEARSWMVSGKVTVALCPGVQGHPLEARELLRRVLAGGRVADVHLGHVRARDRPGVGDRRGHRRVAVGVERPDVEVGEGELRVRQPEPEREQRA